MQPACAQIAFAAVYLFSIQLDSIQFCWFFASLSDLFGVPNIAQVADLVIKVSVTRLPFLAFDSTQHLYHLIINTSLYTFGLKADLAEYYLIQLFDSPSFSLSRKQYKDFSPNKIIE